MAIKNWPIWVKILGIISIIVIALALGVSIWEFSAGDGLNGLITFFIILTFLAIIIGFWIIGFLFYYLKKHNLRFIANIISVIGLISSVIFSFWFIPKAESLFLLPISVVIFFLVALIIINIRK